MVSREILNSHPISTLRKEISKTNIKGYSKMKKPEIVELMMKTPTRFSHIKMNEKAKKKAEPKKKVVKEDSSRLEALLKDDKPKKKAEPKKVLTKTTSGFTDGKVLSMPKAKKAEPKKEEPKKEEPKSNKLPKYNKTIAKAVAEELIRDLLKQGRETYLQKTRSASNVKLYLSQNFPKIKKFANEISSGKLKRKPLRDFDEKDSADFMAKLLEEGKIVRYDLDDKPKKAEPKKKTAEQERRDKLNKMTPEQLMNALPDVAKRNVQKFATNAGDKYRAVVSADMKKYFNISKPNDAQFYSYTPIANKIMGFKSKSDLRKRNNVQDSVEVELGTGKEIEEYFEREHDISPKEIKQKVDKYINEREKQVKKIPKTFIKYARSKDLKKILEAGIGKGTKIGENIYVPLSINNKEKKMTYIAKFKNAYNLVKNQSLDKFEKDLKEWEGDGDMFDDLLD